MPIPRSERDIEDAVERHRREDEARHAHGAPVAWWKRVFAGRLFRLGR
jgi:hypothetical protein